MTVCGQVFSPQVLQRIQQTVDQEPGLSRRALSRRVCEWLDWRSPNGQWKEMSCRVAWGRLERAGIVQLPSVGTFPAPRPRPACRDGPLPQASVQRSLVELQPVEVVPVGLAAQTWNEYLNRYHPQGAGPLCGAQIRYAIRSHTGEWLGGLAFSAAA